MKVETEVPAPGEETGSSEPTSPAEDPPLPQELIDQMKPKHCMLCDIKVSQPQLQNFKVNVLNGLLSG